MIREILNSIKEIILDYVKHRLFPVTVLVFVLFFILIRRLFVLQIVEGDEHMNNFTYKSKKTLSVEAPRGNILDRNGKVLAYNELSYSVTFSNDDRLSVRAKELGVDANELKNKIVYDTIKILESNEDKLYVDFPIVMGSDGKYKFTIKDAQLKLFKINVYSSPDYDSLLVNQKQADAEEVMTYLKNEVFEVSDEYSKDDLLKIIACRYKLWMNRYQQYVPVTIAYDISEKSNAAITENKDELIGIDVAVKSLRRYNDAKYFAHIIGYIGAISDEELKEYNENLSDELKYGGEEMIGKTGIEQYCESDLRGKNGLKTMYVDNLGKIIETVDSEQTVAGNDVYLSIDADLEKYCYDTLEKEIANIILSNLRPANVTEQKENAEIPITAVYFGLFNNNYLTLEKMKAKDATDLEKNILASFNSSKDGILSNLENILRTSNTKVMDLDEQYQDYMEYICEVLSNNNILDFSLFTYEDEEYNNYVQGTISLADFLKYAISIESIDIKSFDVSSSYYDNDEIYSMLCDYIFDYLKQDTEFDKQILKVMLESGVISGEDIVELVYIQGLLPIEGDKEYKQFKNGQYNAYEFMRKKIELLQITPAMLAIEPCSGSVVVTDVNTGDVLAMVSYPSYDNNYLTNEVNSEYYNKLLNDKTAPLYNRACQQATAPGSTYKILTSVAGLTEGVISQDSYINCAGEFDKVNPAPHCWAYPGGHGSIEIQQAIQDSCNMYFYEVGYQLGKKKDDSYSDAYGLERLAKYADMFGLSDLSGVELPETKPRVSDNDIVRSAIGQGKNLYTPVQLARYVTTVANRGTCYNLTLLDKVKDYEGNLIKDNTAEVRNTAQISGSTWDAVQTGMRRVISLGTPDSELINKINVSVAAKSGTAQESEIKPNHALFIAYAPFEKPEVSVTCVIQNGYSSGNARELAGFIMAYMFDPEALVDAKMSGDNKLSD